MIDGYRQSELPKDMEPARSAKWYEQPGICEIWIDSAGKRGRPYSNSSRRLAYADFEARAVLDAIVFTNFQ
jgi:hypothetical protein